MGSLTFLLVLGIAVLLVVLLVARAPTRRVGRRPEPPTLQGARGPERVERSDERPPPGGQA